MTESDRTYLNPEEFNKSITMELNATKNRVRNLIGDKNWGEEGRDRIIPIHEIVKIFELKSFSFIGIVPFFQFPIGLRVVDARLDMSYFIFLKEVFKSAICIAILISLVGSRLLA